MKTIALLLLIALASHAADIKLVWDSPAETNRLSGYQVVCSTGTNYLTNAISGPEVLTTTFTNLSGGTTNWFVAHSVGTNGIISEPSNIVEVYIPRPLVLRVQQSTNITGPWATFYRVEITP